MTNTSKGSNGSSQEPGNGLAERVRARVAEVGLTLAQRTRASRRRANGPRVPRRTPPTPQREAQSPEARSLRRVFNELAVTHREYRLRSGQRVSPALRQAALAFKAGPSLPNLVAVASFLEEDGLIAW